MNENQPPPEDLSVNREFEVQNQLPSNLPQEKPSIWRQEIISNFAVFGGVALISAAFYFSLVFFREEMGPEFHVECLFRGCLSLLVFSVLAFIRLLKKT